MTNWGVLLSESGNKNYLRTAPREGYGISMKNVEVSGDVHSQLKYAVTFLVLSLLMFVMNAVGRTGIKVQSRITLISHLLAVFWKVSPSGIGVVINIYDKVIKACPD